MTTSWQLAQVNIARARAPLGDSLMAEFAGALDEINLLAERSPGFVWRLKDESSNATSIKAFADLLLLVNISVWSDLAALRDYVYRSLHGKFFARRDTWFEKSEKAHLALWWVPAGDWPTVEEAKRRLAMLDARGSTPEAFSFRQPHPSPETISLPRGVAP